MENMNEEIIAKFLFPGIHVFANLFQLILVKYAAYSNTLLLASCFLKF
jgi:hypothetical protein